MAKTMREPPVREDGTLDLEAITNGVMHIRDAKPDNELMYHFETVCLRAMQLEATVAGMVSEIAPIRAEIEKLQAIVDEYRETDEDVRQRELAAEFEALAAGNPVTVHESDSGARVERVELGVTLTREMVIHDYGCPTCGATVREPCLGASGKPRVSLHASRWTLARGK